MGARDEGPGSGGRLRGPGGEEAVAVRGGGGRRGGAGLLLRRRAARRAPRPPRALPLECVPHPAPKPYLFSYSLAAPLASQIRASRRFPLERDLSA